MSRFRGLRQPFLMVILVASVFALACVAYTQHQIQRHWRIEYGNATELQKYWEGRYLDAVAQLPVTLSLSWFGNTPDVDKTKFMDNLHQNIEPVKIEVHKWNAVTFWFEKHEVGNGTILLYLPNQSEGSYTYINVPFFDARLCAPAMKGYE